MPVFKGYDPLFQYCNATKPNFFRIIIVLFSVEKGLKLQKTLVKNVPSFLTLSSAVIILLDGTANCCHLEKDLCLHKLRVRFYKILYQQKTNFKFAQIIARGRKEKSFAEFQRNAGQKKQVLQFWSLVQQIWRNCSHRTPKKKNSVQKRRGKPTQLCKALVKMLCSMLTLLWFSCLVGWWLLC